MQAPVPEFKSPSSGRPQYLQRVTGIKHTREVIIAALDEFLGSTDELTNRAWVAGSRPDGGAVTKLMGSSSFTRTLCEYAAENAVDGKTYLWGLCPTGKRHTPELYFRGSTAEWLAGVCPTCERQAQRRTAWLAAQPTFAELFPDLVPYLCDPAQARSRGEIVAFGCSDCGHGPVPWKPARRGVPRCNWCEASEGRQPGELVHRIGGGTSVKFEQDLAGQLGNLGEQVTTNQGILTKRDSYLVPVIKPDLILPARRIALEVDHLGGRRFKDRHAEEDGFADDQLRDRLLGALGWRVLRIRRSDHPTRGDWPWRIEATPSGTARAIARAVVQTLAPATAGCAGRADRS